MNIHVTMPATGVRDTFFTPLAKEHLAKLGNVTYNPYDRCYTDEEMREALKGVDVVFSGWNGGFFGEEVLKDVTDLKFIAYTAGSLAGTVDEYAYKKDITVLGANCVFAESVAEGTLAYILLGLRRLTKYSKLLKDGVEWKPVDYYNEGIMNRTIGLVGFGTIAKKLVPFLKPFNVDILVYSRHMTDEEAAKYGVTKVTLPELFERSDVVSIHQGLNDKTYHMVTREHLEKMKEGVLFVNTARGAVVDEKALIDVVESGKIHAVLDVYEQEPLEMDSPLRSMNRAVTIPHMGGPTIDRRQYCVIKLVDDIIRYQNGERDLETIIPVSHIANMTRG